jgi:hypothetical protein
MPQRPLPNQIPQQLVNVEVVMPVHNSLGGLQGGSTDERYHVTREMYDWIIEQMGDTPTPPDTHTYYDGGHAGTPEEDYEQNLDGGPAPDEDRDILNDNSGA